MRTRVLLLEILIIFLTLLLVSCEKKNIPPTIKDQTFSIDENSDSGFVVGHVIATDPDGKITSFKIKDGNIDNAFEISDTSGFITVKNTYAIDFETHSSFTLNIEVKDEKNAASTANIKINLNNIEPPTDGLLLYMPFDRNLNDLSSSSNDGVDFSSDNFVTGRKSQALDFNGTSDYIKLSNTINAQNGLTFSFWLNTRGANGVENNGVIISKYSSANNTRSFLVYSFGSGTVRSNNRLSAAFYSDGTTATYYHDMTKSYLEPSELTVYPDPSLWTLVHPTHLITGVWTHCVVNVTPTAIETWINGTLCTKKTREYSLYFNSDTEPIQIGNNNNSADGSNNHFNGMLDELRVYNRGLSKDEIKTLSRE